MGKLGKALGLSIFGSGLKYSRKKNWKDKCACCGVVAVTSCLPFLGGKRFCARCGLRIMH